MPTKSSKRSTVSKPAVNPPRAQRVAASPWFARAYAGIAVIILLATTLLWTILSARLQSSNADQSINAYLFSHPSSLSSAIFPAAHTMLLEWPLFALIKAFGVTSTTLVTFTVITVLLTVGLLTGMIYLIERRLLVFGTLCLALASCLLLVPAQPHAGSLLPVNMAMIATRNLEYVIYIACVFLFACSPKLHSRRFWLAVGLMILLAASDKLFLVLGLGGAALALVVYALASGWNLVSLTVRWLIGGLLAGLGALILLWFFNWSGITHIASSGSGVGPYGVVRSLHNVALGGVYGLLALLTNFGANPAFGSTILRDIPHDAISHLTGISGLTFVINLTVLAGGLFAGTRLITTSLAHNKDNNVGLPNSYKLSIMLLWTTLAGLAVFIFSNHQYAADARYLGISLFALFISLASYSSKRIWHPKLVLLAGLVIVLGIVLAIPSAVRAYNTDRSALASNNSRNAMIASALAHHPVNTLVGDYWRVIPTKLDAAKQLNVMPLAGCTQPQGALTSTAWETNLSKHSFAYLLTLDGSQTDYPNCTLDQVIKNYGRPNTTVLIAGSLNNPSEMLLYYDQGIRKSAPVTADPPVSTVLPISLAELPHTYCSVPTDMNIVAHEDDDLLFMNPDLLHNIQAGHCIRTIYITAGDAGQGNYYWLSREQGSEAAYSTMLGINDSWIERTVKLTDKEYISAASPVANDNVSLIFMHLPDGNLKGQGFASSHFESLAKLESGAIAQIHSVDGQSVYTNSQLTDALTSLMHAYQPAEINTQANYPGTRFVDHSDHLAVGRDVKIAYNQYEAQQFSDEVLIPIKFYIGYPVHEQPPNVSGDDLTEKEKAFASYSMFDSHVCQNLQRCMSNPAYGAYLTREYQIDY